MASKRITKQLGYQITGSIIGRLVADRLLELSKRGSELAMRCYNEKLTTQEERDFMNSAPSEGFFSTVEGVRLSAEGYTGQLVFNPVNVARGIERGVEHAVHRSKNVAQLTAIKEAVRIVWEQIGSEDDWSGPNLPVKNGWSSCRHPYIRVEDEGLRVPIKEYLIEASEFVEEVGEQAAKLYALIMSYRTMKKLLEEMPEASKFVTEEQLAPPQKTQSTAIADVAALKAVVSQAAGMIKEAA